jgi:hypothetical protein
MPCRLVLRLTPRLWPPDLTRRRLIVEVNRRRVADLSLVGKHVMGALVQPEWLAGKAVLGLRLLHPDNLSRAGAQLRGGGSEAIACKEVILEPLDAEEARLAAEIDAALNEPGAPDGALAEPELELGIEELLQVFESAGDNCEFGCVQRTLRVERPGLMHFGGMSAYDLARCVKTRFATFATDGSLEIVEYHGAEGHDFMGHEQRYHMWYHTGTLPGTISADALRRKEEVRLRRLAEKYLEDIELGEKLFVFRSLLPLRPVIVAGLVAAFRGVGPATLVWIQEASGAWAAGTARWLIPGLIVAYVDRLVEPHLPYVNAKGWLAACRAAYGLWRESLA